MPRVVELPSKRWRVQWAAADGRYRSAGRTFPTSTAARNFGLDREAEVRAGQDRDPRAGRIRVRDWAAEWMGSRVVEPRTFGKDQTNLDRHVLPTFGDMRLDQLDVLLIQGWVKRMRTDGLAPATVRSPYLLLSAMLTDAVKVGRLQANPAKGVRLPTIPPGRDFHWTREQASLIAAQLSGQDFTLLEVLVGTGLRWGEAAGLHVGRVDLLRRRLTVAEVLEEARGFRLKAYPKGKRTRQVPLDPALREVLAVHIAAHPPLHPCGLDHGKARCTGLLFHQDGRPLSRHSWPRDTFATAVTDARVPAGRVHDLRHTFASWLVADGVPLHTVQMLLGHASIRTTERYAHLAPDALDDERVLRSLASGRRPGVNGNVNGQHDTG